MSKFDRKLEVIEGLIDKLSSQSIDLETLSKDYREANHLIAEAIAQLESVEKEIALNSSYSKVPESESELG